MTTDSKTRLHERNLLFILKNGPIHAISDHIVYQASALSTEFDCEVWSQGPQGIVEALGNHSRVCVVRSGLKNSLLASVRYVRMLRRRIRECADLYPGRIAVIAHDPHKSGLIGAFVASAVKAPLIVEVNGVYGKLQTYNRVRSSVRVRLKIHIMKLVARFVFRRAAAVRLLFPSQLTGFVSVPKNAVVRIFFDLPSLDRFHNAGEDATVLFVGYPFLTKGVDILIRAFELVSADFPEWNLLLIGHELEESARQYTVNPRVHVLRAMPNIEVATYVNRAGIFVLPSRSEAMGRVLLEAAAAGKVRVGTRIDGIPSVISDGKDGLLFDNEDYEDLAAKLRILMASASLRRSMGDAARRRADSEFSAKSYVSHMRGLVRAAFEAQSLASM